MSKAEWSYYDDMFPEGNEDGFNSDSDFEYDDAYSRKKSKSGGKKGGSKPKGVSSMKQYLPNNLQLKHFFIFSWSV
jgi:hypothetical protein